MGTIGNFIASGNVQSFSSGQINSYTSNGNASLISSGHVGGATLNDTSYFENNGTNIETTAKGNSTVLNGASGWMNTMNSLDSASAYNLGGVGTATNSGNSYFESGANSYTGTLNLSGNAVGVNAGGAGQVNASENSMFGNYGGVTEYNQTDNVYGFNGAGAWMGTANLFAGDNDYNSFTNAGGGVENLNANVLSPGNSGFIDILNKEGGQMDTVKLFDDVPVPPPPANINRDLITFTNDGPGTNVNSLTAGTGGNGMNIIHNQNSANINWANLSGNTTLFN